MSGGREPEVITSEPSQFPDVVMHLKATDWRTHWQEENTCGCFKYWHQYLIAVTWKVELLSILRAVFILLQTPTNDPYLNIKYVFTSLLQEMDCA